MDERRAELGVAIRSAIGGVSSIVLEIGCGHGHFLTAYARSHPREICVGVDIASDRVARANRKREHARLTNLHFIRADASMLLDTLPRNVWLSNVFILFPDPWPKARHHKHRVVQPEFLGRLSERLGKAGRLYFRTDHAPYFEAVCAELDAHPHMVSIDEPWQFEFPTVFQNRASVYHSLVAKVRPSRA